jgi:hypothetical protein
VKIIFFLGPTTLAVADARELLDAEYRPPVSRGDVYRAALEQPYAIGIVDGYFRNSPAVWHKEILWTMNRGIHVFGSASMGALRAAELADFGMVGVGQIFQQFRAGMLEDDDEVAVIHGPSELNYLAASEAMVNVRATLGAARAAGVLAKDEAAGLEGIAKSLFYPDRCYPRILEAALASGMDGLRLAAFREWLPSGRVDQKRCDAIAMLQAIGELAARGAGPLETEFFFEDGLGLGYLRFDAAGSDGLREEERRLLETLRADSRSSEQAEAAALGWMQARENSERNAHIPEALDLIAASRAFCQRHGLTDGEAISRWLDRNGLSIGDLHRLLERQAHGEFWKGQDPVQFEQTLIDYLHWTGDYERLLFRPSVIDSARAPISQGFSGHLKEPSLGHRETFPA